ncbi:acyl-CoA dehydrogenase family protein [Mycobacterium sp. E1747]|uniref:acyl-CoA dehydrogenase family protein n=1 Tax=Mycobacterium sp. E1747 TaxID=1834128 RepID=UPI0008023A10|nr:acyl-CoA dehydrogenase family protein [Mycobacterium sp. E1747]OBH05916.1 acyl-CoA dehydrogenase [Mycobacterium sp. E1747]
MELAVTADLKDFREEARTWLAENVPRSPRPANAGPETREFDAAWHAAQYEGGWAGIDWPSEYGGRGLPLIKQIIWYEELVRAKAPGRGIFGVAFGHAGPTIMLRGNEDQKSYYLPRILRGETPWCQGFSEPQAGSDLASLRTRAVVDGDHLVVNGSKIWTSHAELCDFGELLVRTNPDVEKHRGITWVIMDMSAPGIDVRPIAAIDGYPHNCEVFFDDVRIPLTNVVDAIDNGWSVALSTLAAERGPGFLDERLELIVFVDEMIDYARESGKIKDDALADRLAEARAMAAACRSMAYYQVSRLRPGVTPGPETTAIRTFSVQVELLTSRLAIDLLGVEALEWTPWTRRWLRDFRAPIGGGTKDIHKNIIGERVLGLPR